MAKIAVVSNYDKEMYDETFLTPLVMSETLARIVCVAFNSINPEGEDYYRSVVDNYELKKFTP